MNKLDILNIARQRLSDFASHFKAPVTDPLNISPWIAMSLLQKAIRRGEKQLALRAAATLLHKSPERLWRRLGCIAFEDIGVGDLHTVALVTAAMAGKRIRAELGGEWVIGGFLTSRMSEVAKCRAADDLLMAVESHPDFEAVRLAFPFRGTDDLIRIATGTGVPPIRALATWFAIGTDRRPSSRLSWRQGRPNDRVQRTA
jgi:hypothetical protein